MERALISVILPVYNAGLFVREAIQSVLDQTYTDFELIIINDASTDNSKDIIFSFTDSRIRYVENEHNLKLIKTLNKGIGLAQGEYIARMDADDVSSPVRFERQITFLQNNKDYIMCGSWAKIIDLNGQVTGRIKRINTNGLLRVNMLFTTPFVHPAVMIKTEIMREHLYSEDALHCEDMELWARLTMDDGFKFTNIPEYLLNYRWHDKNISVENAGYQSIHRKRAILPTIERLTGKLSDENIITHFSLFERGIEFENFEVRMKIRRWIDYLLAENDSKKIYNHSDLQALLFSRWLLLGMRSRRLNFFGSGISWYKPAVLIKVYYLLRYK